MDLPSVLSEQLLVHEGGALASRTTLGVGGPAPFIVEPRNCQELLLAVRELSAAGLPYRLLGHGSNLLVSDEGVPEVVLHTRLCQGIYHHGEIDHALRCEAGAPLARLVSAAHELGLSGVEMLIGIPGTLGGAVAGNSGGRDGSISERLIEVTLVDPDGAARAVPCQPDDFGYRRSPFAGQVVLDAVLQLQPRPRPAIMERMTEVLREKARAQPLSAASSGCMFKNPADGSAGRLIDAAGCKDMAEGGVRVSERHANFLINVGDARSAEIMALIKRVRRRVVQSAGVELELEVEPWGRFPATS